MVAAAGNDVGSASTGKRPDFVTTRVFDAPRKLLWEAWSKAEHLAKWLPPNGMSMASCSLDFRPGGRFSFAFRGPNGEIYPADFTFREIVEPTRIVWAGMIHGGLEVVTTVTFDEHDGKTTLTVHQSFSHESDATRGAPSGWGQSLDKLTALVANL